MIIQIGYNEILGRRGALFCSVLQLSQALPPLALFTFTSYFYAAMKRSSS